MDRCSQTWFRSRNIRKGMGGHENNRGEHWCLFVYQGRITCCALWSSRGKIFPLSPLRFTVQFFPVKLQECVNSVYLVFVVNLSWYSDMLRTGLRDSCYTNCSRTSTKTTDGCNRTGKLSRQGFQLSLHCWNVRILPGSLCSLYHWIIFSTSLDDWTIILSKLNDGL